MRSFFEAMAPWPRQEGSLHLYVLPDDGARQRCIAAQEALGVIDHLPTMPPAFLHLTLQRLRQFDDLSQAEPPRWPVISPNISTTWRPSPFTSARQPSRRRPSR